MGTLMLLEQVVLAANFQLTDLEAAKHGTPVQVSSVLYFHV